MSIKTDIERLLKELKRYGKDRRTIEQELKYSVNYIDQLVSKGGNMRFYMALKRYHEMLMQQEQEQGLLREDRPRAGDTVTADTWSAGPDKGFWTLIAEYRSCDYATTARGNAMQPLIMNNAIVGGKLLADPSFIVYGDIYILQARNGMETVRYVEAAPGDGESVLLLALKEGAPATEMRRADILRVYHAQFVVNPL